LLTWDNANSRWDAADAPVSLPDQTSYSGKFLTTNGTVASWGDVAFSSLTGTPTTISGYGITDAFDGAYSSLTGAPDSILDFSITDGTNGQVLTTDGAGNFSFTTVSSGGGGSAAFNLYKFTATSGQTTFSGTDDASQTLSYEVGNLFVTINGVIAENGTDYTATNGTSIVFTTGVATNDEINVYALNVTSVAGGVTTGKAIAMAIVFG
jgi:hypothetical protein